MIINKSEVFYVFPDEDIEGKELYPPRETWEIYVKFLENFNPTKIWQIRQNCQSCSCLSSYIINFWLDQEYFWKTLSSVLDIAKDLNHRNFREGESKIFGYHTSGAFSFIFQVQNLFQNFFSHYIRLLSSRNYLLCTWIVLKISFTSCSGWHHHYCKRSITSFLVFCFSWGCSWHPALKDWLFSIVYYIYWRR